MEISIGKFKWNIKIVELVTVLSVLLGGGGYVGYKEIDKHQRRSKERRVEREQVDSLDVETKRGEKSERPIKPR